MNSFIKITWLLAIIMLSILSNAQSQNVAATTADEYTYGTVGYKMELQVKLPMKKGYSFKELGVYEDGDRKLTFKGLMRDKEDKPCAVILVYAKVRSAPEYFCLPTIDASQEMWSQFYLSLKSETENPEERFKFLARGITKLSAFLMQ